MSELVEALLGEHAARVARFFQNDLAGVVGLDDAPTRIVEAVNYSLLAGGKRVRPALVLEWCRVSGGELDLATAAAAAIETIHTFSLVHDDLPCMDDDDLRRGRPTNHKVFGQAMAVLAGDAMTTAAFEVLARCYEPKVAIDLIRELARATGPAGMIGGQVLDIEAENKTVSAEELQTIHAKKTGALLQCACVMGARLAGGDAQAAATYGQHLGLSFQIADDLLDVSATPEAMGKATGKDATAGKNTYPALWGVDEARRRAMQECDAALAAVEPLGPAADGLRALARFTVERGR